MKRFNQDGNLKTALYFLLVFVSTILCVAVGLRAELAQPVRAAKAGNGMPTAVWVDVVPTCAAPSQTPTCIPGTLTTSLSGGASITNFPAPPTPDTTKLASALVQATMQAVAKAAATAEANSYALAFGEDGGNGLTESTGFKTTGAVAPTGTIAITPGRGHSLVLNDRGELVVSFAGPTATPTPTLGIVSNSAFTLTSASSATPTSVATATSNEYHNVVNGIFENTSATAGHFTLYMGGISWPVYLAPYGGVNKLTIVAPAANLPISIAGPTEAACTIVGGFQFTFAPYQGNIGSITYLRWREFDPRYKATFVAVWGDIPAPIEMVRYPKNRIVIRPRLKDWGI